jgi:hypothetical protein
MWSMTPAIATDGVPNWAPTAAAIDGLDQVVLYSRTFILGGKKRDHGL